MKPALPIASLLLIASTASAQLSVLPQVGVENTATSFSVNDFRYKPLTTQLSPKASVRLDYRFKGGHGPFAGVATSPALVAVNFADPATIKDNFTSATKGLQLRVESGYQYTSPAIFFKKKPAATAKNSKPSISTQRHTYSSPSNNSNSYRQGRCGGSSTYRSSHGSRENTITIVRVKAKPDNRMNMRIQPSAGIAYRPATGSTLEKNASNYTYNAGNWNTSFISGLGLEFGRGSQRLLNVGVHHAKSLGNQSETLTSDLNTKATTNLRSSASSWGLTVGVPFTLSKKKAPVKVVEVIRQYNREKSDESRKCGSYQSRCTRKI
ncbi:MAG TPA: hypothetical protein VM935_11480 [Chitinophagaceae bacterium]|nr:hypothetical protein [Chitinophagaceae bacterium]